MGLFKDLKNMKDTVHAAPGMIREAQALGAQAQAYGQAVAATPMVGTPGVVTPAELEPIAGISLQQYAQFAKTVGEKRLTRRAPRPSSAGTASPPRTGRPRTTAGTPA